ncbi:MAG TPA: HEPN domain-containing protein [Blastocatellia bacterium]|nr:HEPN domain-containing protein [Blastocatellia bacterium]
MASSAYQTFEHAIQDAVDLLGHFDSIYKQPPPPESEVLKRASLVMALAALETYVEDRIIEAVNAVAGVNSEGNRLATFYKSSLENDLKYFHTPSTDRVRTLFEKYLEFDVTEGWVWNNYDAARARNELNRLAKKRGDVAHRSWRPVPGQPAAHVVTRDDMRKHIRFIKDLVAATDQFIERKLASPASV